MEILQRTADIEPPRKKFKASELPLTQQTRATVDSLLHAFKKKGEFDAIRKIAYSAFEDGDVKERFINEITSLAEGELERNTALLGKDRRQAAPLIAGAAERSLVYRHAEEDVAKIIDSCLSGAEEKLREIRRKDVGEHAAAEEHRKGSRTDEEYAQDSVNRRQNWAREREEEEERRRQRELAEQRRLEEERRKKQAEEEERQRLKAIAEEEERKKQEAWEKELEERRERKKRQDAQWARERQEKEERERRKRELEKEKEIEAAALEELIREGKRVAARPGLDEAAPAPEVSKSTSGGKESALAAIMRKEQMEREQARVESDFASPAGPQTSGVEGERQRARDASGSATPQSGQLLRSTSSKVWVREGIRKPRVSGAFGATPATMTTLDTATIATTEGRQDRAGGDRHRESNAYERGDIIDHAGGNARGARDDHEADDDYRSHEPRDDASRDRRDSPTRRERRYVSSASRRARSVDEAHSHGQDYETRSRYDKRSEHDRSPSPVVRRSGHRNYSYSRSRSRSADRRRRERSRDPKDIDRYIPPTSSRREHRDYHDKRDRRDYDDKYERKEQRRDDSRDRGRGDRGDEHDRRSFDRSRPSRDLEPEKKKPVEIDSYIPATSIRARRKEATRDRDRDDDRDYRTRDSAKDRDRDRGRRDRSRSARREGGDQDRDRDRRNGDRDRDRDRSRERYRSRDRGDRERDRDDRTRDRSRPRERERDRSRERESRRHRSRSRSRSWSRSPRR